jgi:hypothetical protein
MFKAKLIENLSYYNLKRRFTLATLISSVVSGLLFGIDHYTSLILAGIFIAMVILLYYQVKFKKQTNHLIRNRKIEIGSERIYLKSRSGKTEEEISLSNVDRIWVQETYKMPEENFRQVLNELAGNHQKNYVIVETAGQKQKFEFSIDSFYMIEQLKKVILQWKEKGLVVETIA